MNAIEDVLLLLPDDKDFDKTRSVTVYIGSVATGIGYDMVACTPSSPITGLSSVRANCKARGKIIEIAKADNV